VKKIFRVKRDPEGFHLIDRNGKLFGYILDYLRDGTVTLPPDLFTTQQLLKEASFYAIQVKIRDVDFQIIFESIV